MGRACNMQEATKIVIKFLCRLALSCSNKKLISGTFVSDNETSVSTKVRNS